MKSKHSSRNPKLSEALKLISVESVNQYSLDIAKKYDDSDNPDQTVFNLIIESCDEAVAFLQESWENAKPSDSFGVHTFVQELLEPCLARENYLGGYKLGCMVEKGIEIKNILSNFKKEPAGQIHINLDLIKYEPDLVDRLSPDLNVHIRQILETIANILDSNNSVLSEVALSYPNPRQKCLEIASDIREEHYRQSGQHPTVSVMSKSADGSLLDYYLAGIVIAQAELGIKSEP